VRLAFLFPGQGSQHPGMGRALAEARSEAMEVFAEAEDVLSMPLRRLCFEGTEAELASTEVTQPALLAVGVACLRAIQVSGIRPEAAAGLSLGEYGAMVCAGVLDFAAASGIVRKRAAWMQEAVPEGAGGMAAVIGLSREAVASCLADGVWIANLNCPGQIVISGLAEPLSRAMSRLAEAGAKRVVELKVSGPFHTPLLEPAARNLYRALDSMVMAAPAIPVYANSTASVLKTARECREALSNQVVSAVLWEDSMRAMIADGFDTFVELGPGRTLSGFLSRLGIPGVTSLRVEDPESLDAAVDALSGGMR